MSESFGSVKHGTLIGTEFLSVTMTASRRIRAQVNDYVIDSASRATDQFGFFVGLFLVMHTAKRSSLKIEGGVELEHIRSQPMLGELFAAPSTGEIAPVILNSFLSDYKGPLKRCFDEFHKEIL
jgi:hypothetical protein